jgi:hypothetical protein
MAELPSFSALRCLVHAQAQGLSNRPREFSQHGMRLQQHSKPGAAWGTPASAAQGSRQGQQTPPGMQQVCSWGLGLRMVMTCSWDVHGMCLWRWLR